MKKLRARTLRIERNGLVYWQTMLPNGDIEIREHYGRQTVPIRAEEIHQLAARLNTGALFPEDGA